jgi:hypothetical protein
LSICWRFFDVFLMIFWWFFDDFYRFHEIITFRQKNIKKSSNNHQIIDIVFCSYSLALSSSASLYLTGRRPKGKSPVGVQTKGTVICCLRSYANLQASAQRNSRWQILLYVRTSSDMLVFFKYLFPSSSEACDCSFVLAQLLLVLNPIRDKLEQSCECMPTRKESEREIVLDGACLCVGQCCCVKCIEPDGSSTWRSWQT